MLSHAAFVTGLNNRNQRERQKDFNKERGKERERERCVGLGKLQYKMNHSIGYVIFLAQ